MKNTQNSVTRPWGYFTNLTEGQRFLVKIIHVNPAERLSVQSHNHRSEHWVCVKGECTVLLNNKTITLKEGQSIDIPQKAVHSLQNNTAADIEIIEIQRGDILSEDDIIRYEDIYGRA